MGETKEIKKQRSHAFDLLCGLCIIRMVMLHITEATQLNNTGVWKEIMHWSFYFMCFFFFKAGYFNKSVAGNTKQYIKDRFRRLMVPYLVWGCIGSIVYFSFCAFVLPSGNAMVRNVEWQHAWQSSAFYGNDPVWFLMSFFMMYVCVHLMEKVRHLHWIAVVFPFLSWWLGEIENPLWLSLNNVFMGIFVFYLGGIWHKALDIIGRMRGMAVSVLMTGAFCYINASTELYYQMSSNQWTGEPQWVLCSIVLALCGISGILLTARIPRLPVVNYIGEHSMVFFVAHFLIVTFYKMLRSAYVRTLRGHEDDLIILTILVFVTCFWLVPYVERVPWLSGRFSQKKPKTADALPSPNQPCK